MSTQLRRTGRLHLGALLLRPLIGLLIGLLISGCGTLIPSAAGYQARDQQQSGPCDGVPAPKSLSLLDPSAHVAAAVICTTTTGYVAGQGIWNYAELRPLPAAKIADLVAGLRGPDVAADPNGACTAMLTVVPNFVLTLADGSRIRPGVPGDGCHPRMDSLRAFGDPLSITPTTRTRTTRILTDLGATTNCGAEAKSPAIWLSGNTRAPGGPMLPTTGSVSICRYRATVQEYGVLAAAGIKRTALVRQRWPAVTNSPPPGCVVPADPTKTAPVDWLELLVTPNPPYTLDHGAGTSFALLELGGCRRLVDPQHGLIGYVSAAAAAQLTGLADEVAK